MVIKNIIDYKIFQVYKNIIDYKIFQVYKKYYRLQNISGL